MTEQAQLFPLTAPDTKQFRTIQARFEQFHEINPQVFELLLKLAKRLADRGFKHASIGMLWETLRWHYLESIGPVADASDYRLNDHYRSRYARLLMEKEPSLRGFFETRTLTAK